jgi:hypothetical protein
MKSIRTIGLGGLDMMIARAVEKSGSTFIAR